MPLEEVRQRLRPLIDDPDDPIYPGSPDAPTLAAPASDPPGRRAEPSGPDRGHSATSASRVPAAAGPQARRARWPPTPVRCRAARPPRPPSPAPPSPIPPRPPREPPVRGVGARRHGWSHGPAMAGAAVVLPARRSGRSPALGGQSPLMTHNVTSASTDAVQHIDPRGFTIPVPTGWSEPPRRPTRSPFVSEDGSEDLTVPHGAVADAARRRAGSRRRTAVRPRHRPAVPGTGAAWVSLPAARTPPRARWRVAGRTGEA